MKKTILLMLMIAGGSLAVTTASNAVKWVDCVVVRTNGMFDGGGVVVLEAKKQVKKTAEEEETE